MKITRLWKSLIGLILFSLVLSASAGEMLSLKKVNDHVYSVVGPLGNRAPGNLGNNATFGFVVTGEGVVLIDSGGSYQGAAAIHKLIRQVTDKPVKIVINSGGQDHRWLGNGYFKERGARIIASRAAVADQRARARNQLFMLGNLVGVKGLEGTEAVHADEVFDKSKRFTLGGVAFELHHAGPAHTPGDSFIWIPKERIVFTGDIVYIERMLGVMEYSNSRNWIKVFEAVAALEPEVLIPGHGAPTTLARARADTYDYLVFLRKSIRAFMDSGGDVTQISTLDQSRFSHLQNYDTLKGRNAQQVYQGMEWE